MKAGYRFTHFAMILMVTAMMAAGFPAAVYAADNVVVSSENNTVLKGWVKKGDKTYYYGKNHKPYSGWHKIKKKWYYFNKKTKVMAVNTIAGDKKKGYYYFGNDGVRVKNKTVRKAVQIVRSCTKKGMSREEKVEACFQYVVRKCRYQSRPLKPSVKRLSSFAYNMYVTKRGHCYMSAAAVAYCAKVIGCPVRMAVGGKRKGAVSHGWAEVKLDGKWYVYDASRQRWSSARDLGKISWNHFYNTWKNTRHNIVRNGVYSLKIKGGKAVWKKGS